MQPTVLYRHYDADGIPIYYGISEDNATRQSAHQLYSTWIALSARCEQDEYPSRTTAMAAERQAIQTDRPIFNITHNGPDAVERAVRYLADRERYDLLRPRSAKDSRQNSESMYEKALWSWIRSHPMSSDGVRRIYEGQYHVWLRTDEEAFEHYSRHNWDPVAYFARAR